MKALDSPFSSNNSDKMNECKDNIANSGAYRPAPEESWAWNNTGNSGEDSMTPLGQFRLKNSRLLEV